MTPACPNRCASPSVRFLPRDRERPCWTKRRSDTFKHLGLRPGEWIIQTRWKCDGCGACWLKKAKDAPPPR